MIEPAIRVPPTQVAPLEALARLADEAFLEVLRVLDGPGPLHVAERSADLATVVPEDFPGGSRRLMRTLLGTASLNYMADGSTSEQMAISIAQSSDLDLDDEERSVLGTRLARLFETKALPILAKSVDVLTDHERLYLSGRVLSDVRSVFGPSDSIEPIAAVIVHHLRIDYQTREGQSGFYVAMDPTDLVELRDAVNRALEKGEALEALMAETGVPTVRLEEVDP